MDDLKTLKEWRSGTSPMPAAVEDSIRARLHAMTDESPAPAPRRRSRRFRRPVLGALLATGAAAAAAVTLLGGSPADVPRTELTGRTVLLAAAEKAQRQPATSGRYWHTATVRKSLLGSLATGVDGPPRFRMYERERSEYWAAADPRGKDWLAQTKLGMEPVTRADEDAWKRLKCPDFLAEAPGDGDCTKLLRDGRRKVETGRIDYGFVPTIDKKLTVRDFAALPADPARLREALNRHLGHRANDQQVFEMGSDLVLGAPVSPRVRAAAFRMIAALPAIHTLGELTDPLGRKGTAVSLKVAYDSLSLDQRLIIDPSTGLALTSYTVAVKNDDGRNGTGIKKGEIQSSESLLEASWTDTHP
ncbi:CU044_5270 family protein [Actinomadura hibisca]|uniref:CU044_5270 family protein n=1 Tax=Actinomadura hibisca TaxID=68565 RepID=UPI000835DED9|nr:CU044_5270 family protein [Actinomadura hibisca]